MERSRVKLELEAKLKEKGIACIHSNSAKNWRSLLVDVFLAEQADQFIGNKHSSLVSTRPRSK